MNFTPQQIKTGIKLTAGLGGAALAGFALMRSPVKNIAESNGLSLWGSQISEDRKQNAVNWMNRSRQPRSHKLKSNEAI